MAFPTSTVLMEGDSRTSPSLASEPKPDSATLFIRQLDKYERAPRGLRESWQATQEGEESSTARIFLDEGGFPAWFAYFLAKNAAEHHSHFAGKADYKRLIANLENEPVASRKALAARVAASIPTEAKTKTSKLFEKKIKPLQSGSMPQHANKRRRTIGNGCPPASTNPPSATPTPSSASAHHTSLDPSVPEQAVLHTTLDCDSYFAEDEHFLVNASLEAATNLLPQPLSDAIGRNPDPMDENSFVAAISMAFPVVPFTDKFACQMALEITDDKVPHFALEWFGVRLETKAGLRYVCIADGSSKILPNPKFTLQGYRRHLIPSTFGPEMSKAIMTSPLYQDDAKQCRSSTDSVSMVISHQAHDRAVVCVSLGLWEGTRIKKKLFV